MNVDIFFRGEFETYDTESLVVATSRVEDATFLDSCLLVDQLPVSAQNARNVLAPPFDGKVIAVVDRTADITAAARAIVRSKCHFQGSSPYAVDLVLVNEWVKKDFIQCCNDAVEVETDFVKTVRDSRRTKGSEPTYAEGEVLVNGNGFVLLETLAE